ncbi:MAG: hypothetical protein BJ554DRAFT_7287 [Olpidium bornovanus]|uniref:Uncharacterized protein n=1 Tax=Olpidium bornovanus TaxID=278681 RepID=A0A8H7ZWW5_9FUNG|nr:MAG: hypothetical protein BJ554DRAFT_7287 [Olpidium bornovanus]
MKCGVQLFADNVLRFDWFSAGSWDIRAGRNQWRKPVLIGNLPVGRTRHTASVVGTRMYIFGGLTENYYLNDMVILDTANCMLPTTRFSVRCSIAKSSMGIPYRHQ